MKTTGSHLGIGFASLAAAACLVVLPAATVLGADDEPDLSTVTLELRELPDGFRVVPDDQLGEFGGSARDLGQALEGSLENASLQQYVVYASESGDEIIEVLVVGPLVQQERIGFAGGMREPTDLVDALTPFMMYVDQTDPVVFDTEGIGTAAVGFTVDRTVNSDLAVAKNLLGVEWTESTFGLVMALNGDYLLLVATNHVGSGDPQVDLATTARHVDAHLTTALTGEQPTTTPQYRPAGTFSPEVATYIPTMTQVSTDPPVVFANLVLAALAVLALTVAMRLLNTTLVAHEDALESMMRPARAVGRWYSSADAAVQHRTGRAAGVIRVLGVLLFYGILFSFLEDGWRPWTVSGLFVLVAMTIAFGLVGTGDDLAEMRSASKHGLPAKLVVKPALVLMAVGSVTLTKLASLVPGLMIGTPEAFSLEDEVDERNELRLARVGLGVTAAVGLSAWALSAPLGSALDGGGGFTQSVIAALVTILVLVFAVAVENLFANLLAFPGSEGSTLRRNNRPVWWVCMIAITALFFQTLLNPTGDLAQSLHSTNVRVVLATVVAFLLFTIAVWWWFRRQDQQQPPAPVFAPPHDQPVELAPPLQELQDVVRR